MKVEEATRLMAALLAAFPNAQPPAASLEVYYEHLEPLPAHRAEQGIDQVIAGVDREPRAQPFFPSIAEVLGAIGIHGDARRELRRARRTGGELWPSLRSMSGWEFVPRGGPYPEGVALYFRENDIPLPAGARVALPAAPEAVGGAPADPGASIRAGIGTDLQQRKTASLRRAVEQLQHPPVPLELDRAALPAVLREALVAADVGQESWAREKARLGAEVRAYEEMRGELAEMIRQGAPDNEAGRAVAVELLRRLVADPGYGLAAVAEVVRDALCPGAEVAVKPEHGANPDPFDEGVGPLVALRIAMRKSV